jgi:hypothetical protein
MGLKHSEVAALLTLVASIDNRTITDADVAAWHAMAQEGGWPSFAAARRALLVYRSEQPDYPIRPGHITQVLNRIRAVARGTWSDRDLPRDVLDDPQRYRQHLNRSIREHEHRYVAEWAGPAQALPRQIGQGR